MDTRLKKLQRIITKCSLDAFLISSIPNIFYLTNYAGFSKDEREAYLLVTNDKSYIFTDGRYTTAMHQLLPSFSLCEISTENPFLSLLQKIIQDKKITVVGFEDIDIRVSEFTKLQTLPIILKPTPLVSLRVQKEKEEIEHIQKACDIGDKAFTYILTKITDGISEKELAFELELFIKKQGSDVSFPSIVAFGKNAAIPHHHTSDTILQKNSFILLDFGITYNNYCSDMTRTVVFGKASDKQKRIYQTVKDAQQKAIDLLHAEYTLQNAKRTIVTASGVDNVARKYIFDQGFPSIPHSVGHGIGIEVHESPHLSPHSKDVLTEGMIFSIEPGIYEPSSGGVRIEDLVVLEKTGPRFLTNAPRELIEIV